MQRVSLAFHELRGKGFPARAAEIKLDDFKFLFSGAALYEVL